MTQNTGSATTLREALEMIRDDAAADASRDVPMTPLGLGTARGEELAMTQALAKACLTLLSRIEALEAALDRAEAAAIRAAR